MNPKHARDSCFNDNEVSVEMYPQQARLRNLTYAGDIVADIEYTKRQGNSLKASIVFDRLFKLLNMYII